jgi:hypothetical protein
MTLKRIRIKEDRPELSDHERRDTKKLVEIFHKKGYIISPPEAKILWEKYSESLCAGWMIMGEDDETIFQNVVPYFEVIDED